MQYPLCRHIRTNGLQCKAPSLTRAEYCYFHDRLLQRHNSFRTTPASRGYIVPGQHIELAPIEDAESVQFALSIVINALATGQLEIRRATALLYGLQLASMNTGRLNLSPYGPDVVRTVDFSPEGLDLAEPGALLSVPDACDDTNEEDDEQDEGD